MTCEECSKNNEGVQKTLDRILVSQIQAQESLKWIQETIHGLATGFQDMMSKGGPLAMIKALRSSKND